MDSRAMNDQAAHLFGTGLFLEAAKVWSRVLREILPYIQGPSDEVIETSTAHEMMICVHPLVPYAEVVLEERIFSIFDCALVYSQTETGHSVYSLDDYRRFAASTVYNIGLSHHLQGLRGATSQQDLAKAQKAYKAAAELFSASASATDITLWTEEERLLALAIANNEGHIFA